MIDREIISVIFIVAWVALIIISWLIFFVSKSARLKRKLFPAINIGNGALFITFIYLLGFAIHPLMVGFVILIIVSNFRQTKFCDLCGRTVISYRLLSRPEFCKNCGSKLNE